MPTDDERRAAFTAVKAQIDAIVTGFARSYVTDDHIWTLADAAVWAAEDARKHAEQSSQPQRSPS